MSRWKKGSAELCVERSDERRPRRETVEAYVSACGTWAAHREYNHWLPNLNALGAEVGGKWRLTLVPTGRALPISFESLDAARQFADRVSTPELRQLIERHPPKWGRLPAKRIFSLLRDHAVFAGLWAPPAEQEAAP